MIRKRIHFYGRVQGVGFRYTAGYCARSLDLTGWAENEYDGSVCMEVQGSEGNIDRMLARLNDDPYIRIEQMCAEEIPLDPQERGFHSR